MGHTLLDIIYAGIGSVFGVAIAFAFGGGLPMTDTYRHHKRALRIGRGLTVLVCVYPVLWAWHAPYPHWIIFTAGAVYGGVFGLMYWLLGHWYRSEVEHGRQERSHG